MHLVGIDWTAFVAFGLNLSILVVWLFLVVWSLRRLRSAPLSPWTRLLWTGLAVLVPVLGAIAVLLVIPSAPPSNTGRMKPAPRRR